MGNYGAYYVGITGDEIFMYIFIMVIIFNLTRVMTFAYNQQLLEFVKFSIL